MTSGYMSIKEPKDLEKALVTMLNKILLCDDPLGNSGRFANLANAWVSTRKLRLDSEEVAKIKERPNLLESQKEKEESLRV